MSAISKQFLAANAVDETKVLFSNTGAFKALSSTAVSTPLFNFSATNNLQLTVQLDANSNAIINVPNPVNPGDAVNFATAQALIAGLSWKEVVRSATTVALPAYTYLAGVITEIGNGALPAQDGVTLAMGDRVLVKNETGANLPYNGIYVVTATGSGAAPFVLTRSSDANTATLLQSSAVSVGAAAATQAGTVWFENQVIVTLGTTPLQFVAITAGITYTFGNGLTVTGTVVSVLPDPAGAIAVSGTGVAAVVDGTTIKIVTDALHGLASKVDNITLGAGDITNQYIDVTFPIASVASVWMSVIGGPVQQFGVDYSVSATGGSGGVGRVTFLNGLATGGVSALVSGNTLVIGYDHF